MEYFIIYLYGILKGVTILFSGLGIATLLGTGLAVMEGDFKDWRYPFHVGIACLVVAILLPSKESVKYMVAYHVGKVAVAEMSPELEKGRAVLNNFLDSLEEEEREEEKDE